MNPLRVLVAALAAATIVGLVVVEVLAAAGVT